LNSDNAMADEKVEEETYSLILTSLKHPLRRKILRMLSNRPFSFSEILESLAIDSGHLNYHLKNLGDLVTHTQDGNYTLSTAGWAAVKLMGKVEEQEETAKTNKRIRRTSKTAIIFSAIFAVCLLTAAIYALTYTTQDESVLFTMPTDSIRPKLINLQPGDQYNYSISLNTLNFMTEDATAYSIGQYETVVELPPPNNSIARWTRYFSKTGLWLAPNDTKCSVYVTVYDPNDKIVIQYRIDTLYTGPSNILQGFEFSDFGTYRLQFENLGDDEVTAVLVPCGGYTIYEKPLFNYGIGGLIILLLYPILFFLSWKWTGKNRNINHST
jgi:DNA-binding transcriptional ArsR family regulator